MQNSQLVHPYLDQAYSCIKNIYRWDIFFWGLEVGGPSQRDQRGVGPAVCWNWGEWGLKEYKWNGSFLVCSFELVVRYKRFLSCLAALFRPVQKFVLTVHFFNLCVPNAQQPGQAVVQSRLSMNVCLRSQPSRAGQDQGVTKRCRLSCLTNSALVQYMSPNARGGGGELRGLSQWVQL